MIPEDLRMSGTYLLCNGNRIHKFRIKWCSKRTPTVEQINEVMRVTEDIVKSNNLPRRIITGQLKIITKISFWSPRSKALSLRQFRSEKQGHLSAHKHSYVLLVFLAGSKEQDCEHLPTYSLTHSVQLQPFNADEGVPETVGNNTELVQIDGIQVNTKDSGPTMHEDKPLCQTHTCTTESDEVIVDKYDGEQNDVSRTSESVYHFVSRIEKLVEKACMAAKVYQSQTIIVRHGDEQDISEVTTDSMKSEIVDCNAATGPTAELRDDLKPEPEPAITSVNAWKNCSFPITDAETVVHSETVVQDGNKFTHDKCVTPLSSTKKFSGAHLQVATAKWKFGNIKVSTNRNLEMFDLSKAVLYRQCSACNVHIPKLPVDYKEENVVAKPQACEIPLTVSSYSSVTRTVTQNYKLPPNMNKQDKRRRNVISRKRRHNQNESDICQLPKKKRMIIEGISPIILGPTSFQEFSPYHTGVMSEYIALRTFEGILGRPEGRKRIESNLTNLNEKLESWLMYQSIISRLRAVPRVNNDKELREILRYVIRNLRNRSANMAFTQQNEKLVCSTPPLLMHGTHSDSHTERMLIMESQENETMMQDLSRDSWKNTLDKIGAGCYKNASVLHMKTSSHCQELRAFNRIVSIKQEQVPAAESNSLQDTLHMSRICEPAIEDTGEGESSKVQNFEQVGSIDTKNNRPLEAESTEKLRRVVKGNNSLFRFIATSENLPKDKDKHEVETNGAVHIFNFGDDFSGMVNPKCQPEEEEAVPLGNSKRPLQIDYGEVCIPNVSYCKSSHFTATNSLKQKECIGCSSARVVSKEDNAVYISSDTDSLLQINCESKEAEHSLAKPTTNGIADVFSDEILLNAATKLDSLKELCTISSIRALRKNMVQQGFLKAIEQTKLSSLMSPECSVPTCSRDFSGQHFNTSLNNTHEVPSKLRSKTDPSASANSNTLGEIQDGFDTNVGASSEIHSSVLDSPVTNDCKNSSQKCKPQSFHSKTTSKRMVPVVPSVHSKATLIAKPVRVNVGKLLSCSKTQVFLTTELYVNTECSPRFSNCKLHSLSPKLQASLIGGGDLVKSFLHFMTFNASQNACVENQSQINKNPERNKLHVTSPNECVVNSSKTSVSHPYNFLKCTCLSVETTESISSTVSYCKCRPSVKFQGEYASYTVMSSQTKIKSPRRQLVDMFHNIKSNVKDRRNICHGKHCFYFHVDKEESVEGFYSTVEKYCSALSKFQSHQYSSSSSTEILLRDIWLPGQKHSISFYINLPLQKCKCSYCGLDTTVELCLNCGDLFERTESGNYVPFDNKKTPRHVDMKMEISEAAVQVLNLVNDLYLCKPVVVIQQSNISLPKQNKTSARRRKKSVHTCCKI